MQIKKILKQLGKATKPVIVAGGGGLILNLLKELKLLFAERYQIPVVTSLLGQGTITTSHPSSWVWVVCTVHMHLIFT